MFFFITFCDERVLLGRNVFINDGDVNRDGGIVRRKLPIKVDVMTIELR